MAANESEQPEDSAGWTFLQPFRGTAATLVLITTILVVFMWTSYWAWQRWGGKVIETTARRITMEELLVTPQPQWISADVKSDVFRDGSLDELSLLDKELAYKVFRAFELHAWISKVDRVSKQPAGLVQVDVVYRKPVAWVEVPSRLSPLGEAGMLPIDRDAVLLPPEDLRDRVGEYLRISISDLPPWGLKGTPWASRNLLGAARLAAELSDCWQELGLYRIQVSSQYNQGDKPNAVYEIETREGQRFVWGSAPGFEAAGEASATAKITALKQQLAKASTVTPAAPTGYRQEGFGP